MGQSLRKKSVLSVKLETLTLSPAELITLNRKGVLNKQTSSLKPSFELFK
jgi:hypothetical protein